MAFRSDTKTKKARVFVAWRYAKDPTMLRIALCNVVTQAVAGDGAIAGTK
jgi:hypothetical protein